MDRAGELDDEIRSSAGFKALMQLELLSLNFYIFDMNYKQWKEYASSLKHTENFLKLWDQNNRKESNLVLGELTRLLLNFLGSATSLVAVTRNSVPVWYKDTKIAQEYDEKKEQIKSDEEAMFIEGLRNYAQHDKLPFVTGQFTVNIQEKSVATRFILDRDILLQGDWKKEKGKDFLLRNRKEIDIEDIVDDYYKKILEFHQWIFSRIQETNSQEIQITSEKQDELRKLLKEIFAS